MDFVYKTVAADDGGAEDEHQVCVYVCRHVFVFVKTGARPEAPVAVLVLCLALMDSCDAVLCVGVLYPSPRIDDGISIARM